MHAWISPLQDTGGEEYSQAPPDYLCPAWSSHLGLPGLPALASQDGETSVPSLHQLPVLWPGNHHETVSRGSGRAPLFVFHLWGNHCPLLLSSSVLETLASYMLSSFPVVSGGWVGGYCWSLLLHLGQR